MSGGKHVGSAQPGTRRVLGLALALLAVGLGVPAPAAAKPAHLKALAEHYGAFLGKGLATCNTCHLPSTSGKAPASLADFPHNAFGKRMAAVREELATAGKRPDLALRLRTVAGEDSDGDGAPNQVELLAGRAPGDPKDRPTTAERAAVSQRLPKFVQFQNAYRWRPFEPVQRPAVPKVADPTWARNPVDAFVAAEHAKRGLKPRPEASRAVLLRRVYMDLTGLSPTPLDLRAFLADRSPDAYEKVVDRLLASPQYGERWARHWMDVWRYSDWTGWGAQVRDSQPHVWRWRDWIVESLNADKGYDRMVVEMLAADEAAPTDANALRATGYLVRNFKLLSREKWMEDVVDHTGQAFLGLTVGCARCHDHMYDPVTQKEYYQFRAFFEPHHVRTDWVPGQLDRAKDGLARAYDSKPDDPTYLYVRGDERQPVKDTSLKPGVPESLGGRLEIAPVPLPLLARVPEKQPHVLALLREEASTRLTAARKAMEACKTPAETALAQLKLQAAEGAQAALEAVLAAEALEDSGKKDSEEWKQAATAALLAQRRQAATDARVKQLEASRALEQGATLKPDELKKAQAALAAAEAALKKAEEALQAPPSTAYQPRALSSYPAASTGRRLALARWITARENPLAARVAVNHMWLRHFGEALVPSVADLGRNGRPPTHPQLLDWLAAELMGVEGVSGSRFQVSSSGNPKPELTPWSMKRVHRLLVTSRTYRMASTPDLANLAKDADNRYLWRANSQRMDAEIVRDNVLHVSGQLDRQMGGPELDQNLGMTARRRSLYFRSAQEKQMVFLNLFDGPSVVECYARKQTVAPQQALALANSELAITQARVLARSLADASGADAVKFVKDAFERVLARPATPGEVTECVRFLTEQPRLLAEKAAGTATAATPTDVSKPAADPALRARENLVLVLLNHNDFVTVR